jgi:hypothetical protein
MTETAGQIDIFEVLAAAELDEQNSRIQRCGIPILFAGIGRMSHIQTELVTRNFLYRNCKSIFGTT